MRLPLQLVALGSALAVTWIAFAHAIHLPGEAGSLDSMAPPLLALSACGLGLAWSYRASLRRALERAAAGASDPLDARAAAISVGLLVVFGFLLRIARTGEYGFNPDEAQLVWLSAAATPGEVWRSERALSPHPPAIFFAFHYMLQLSWDLAWLRLPAVLGGAFSIWMSYRLARELVGTSAAVAVAWLVAFSPPLVELSRVARNYAPGFAFVLLALFLFVRFVKTWRWRYFALYTAAATIAVTWHYVFLVVFISMKVVLAIELLRSRAPFSAWLRVAAIQLPFAAAMLFLYVEHISALPAVVVDLHQQWFGGMLEFDPTAPLDPLGALWSVLAPGGSRAPLIAASVVGVGVLAIGRQWLPLAFCAIPLVCATGFAWSGRIPLGDTRHSFYLFPFLFMLAASNVPEILTGYRTTRSNLARLGGGLRSFEPRGEASLRLAGWGSAAAAALAVIFAASSLLDYNGEEDRNPFFAGSYHGDELAQSYPQADVEHAFELLEQYAGPDDWVLLGFQGAFALRLHLRLRPVASNDERDLSMLALGDPGPLRQRHGGVQYYFSNVFPAQRRLNDLVFQIRNVKLFYGVKGPRKIWLMRGAWAPDFLDRFHLRDARIPVDLDARDASRGLLLGIDTRQLRRGARQPEDRLPPFEPWRPGDSGVRAPAAKGG